MIKGDLDMMKEVVVGGINIKGALRKEVGKGGILLIRIIMRMVMVMDMLELDRIGN